MAISSPHAECGVLPTYRVSRHQRSVLATGRRAGPCNTNRGRGLRDYNETRRRCRGLISTWRSTMRRRALLAVGELLSVALLLNGCAADTEQAANTAETSVQTLIEAHDLAGMDAVEMIDHLDRVPMEERPTDLLASVMPDQLVLASATEEVALELPEDAF